MTNEAETKVNVKHLVDEMRVVKEKNLKLHQQIRDDEKNSKRKQERMVQMDQEIRNLRKVGETRRDLQISARNTSLERVAESREQAQSGSHSRERSRSVQSRERQRDSLMNTKRTI